MTDRVALVTGASRGIGKAIALALAEHGADLALLSRDKDALDQVQAEIVEKGRRCQSYPCDVGCDEGLESSIERMQKELGAIDILVNNAGIYATAALLAQPLSQWRAILEVNLTAAMRASQAVLPQMIERKWGRIINISSISGKSGEPYGAAYSASKFGMIGMTEALALEVAANGITVNAVCPGWVDTEMAHKQLTDEKWCQLNKIESTDSLEIARLSVPQERFIEPDEVAILVAYLCSHAARGITGQAINICGGLSLH